MKALYNHKFLARKVSMSILCSFIEDRAGVMIFTALLNNLSEAVLVAGTHKYFLATYVSQNRV